MPRAVAPAVIALVLAVAALLVPGAASGAELVYYHEKGCPWCEEWEADILPIWEKTWEGQRIPLRPVRSVDPWPEDLQAVDGLVYTPTFVLVTDDGREVGRITGYQPDFFWPMLDSLIGKLDAIPAKAPVTAD